MEKEFIIIFKNKVPTVCKKEQLLLSKKYTLEEEILIEDFSYTVFEEYKIGNDRHLRPINKTFLLTPSCLAVEERQTKLNIIGEGVSGKVYQRGDSPLVFKEFSRIKNHGNDLSAIITRELATLSTLKNEPNIVHLYGYMFTKNRVQIYLKKMENNSIDYFKGKEKLFLFDMLKGCYNMNKKGILHLDLKFENCLTDLKDNIEITDFGNSIFYPYGNLDYCENIITPSYRSIEIYKKCSFDRNVDIFSIGIIAVELYKNQSHLFTIGNGKFSRRKIINYFPDLESDIHLEIINNMVSNIYNIEKLEDLEKEEVKFGLDFIEDDVYLDLCKKMLHPIKEKRATFADCLNHPYFDSVRTENFVDHSYVDILNSLKVLKSDKCLNLNKYRKYKIFKWLFELVKLWNFPLMTFLLCLRIVNICEPVDDDIDIQYLGCASLILSSYLTYHKGVASFKSFTYFGLYEGKLENYLFYLYGYFNMDLYGTIPLMYIKKINPKICRKLFLCEIYNDKLNEFHPKDIAFNICKENCLDGVNSDVKIDFDSIFNEPLFENKGLFLSLSQLKHKLLEK